MTISIGTGLGCKSKQNNSDQSSDPVSDQLKNSTLSPNSMMSNQSTPVKNDSGRPPTSPPPLTGTLQIPSPKPSPLRQRIIANYSSLTSQVENNGLKEKDSPFKQVLHTIADQTILDSEQSQSDHTSQTYDDFNTLIENMTHLEIAQKIGKGNDGDVFIAKITSSSGENILVAMKVLKKENNKNIAIPTCDGIITTIQKPIQINLATKQCVFMPLMDGDLGKKLSKDSKSLFHDIFASSKDHILAELIKFLNAVNDFHKNNILHRDLRLKNLFISNQNNIWIGDTDSAINVVGTNGVSETLTSELANSIFQNILGKNPKYIEVSTCKSPQVLEPKAKNMKIQIDMDFLPPKHEIGDHNRFTIKEELAMVLTCLLELVFLQSFEVETNMELLKQALSEITSKDNLDLTSTFEKLTATDKKGDDQKLLEDIKKRISNLKSKLGDEFTLKILNVLNSFWEKLRSPETNFTHLLNDIIAKLESKKRTYPLEGSSSDRASKKLSVSHQFGRPPL